MGMFKPCYCHAICEFQVNVKLQCVTNHCFFHACKNVCCDCWVGLQAASCKPFMTSYKWFMTWSSRWGSTWTNNLLEWCIWVCLRLSTSSGRVVDNSLYVSRHFKHIWRIGKWKWLPVDDIHSIGKLAIIVQSPCIPNPKNHDRTKGANGMLVIRRHQEQEIL